MAPEALKIAIPAKVAAVLLVVAVVQWSWDYYDILRLAVCGIAGYTAWWAKQQKSDRLLWIMVAVAAVYNPIAPVHFERNVWILLHLGSAALFWLVATKPKRLL